MAINCIDDILEKIKNKDFEIGYKEAIDLVKIFDSDLTYIWVETLGSKESKLMYVEIGMLSGVKLHIKD